MITAFNKFFFFIIICFTATGLQAQKNIEISMTYGLSTPTGAYANYKQANDTTGSFGVVNAKTFGFTQKNSGKNQFNLDVGYYFSKFGMGISIGRFNHQITDFTYNIDFPYEFNKVDISGTYYGLGAQYKLKAGKFFVSPMFRAGLMNIKMKDSLIISYNGSDSPNVVHLRNSYFDKTQLPYVSAGFKVGAGLSDKINVFIKADYFTGLGNITYTGNYYKPIDIDQNNEINVFDVAHFTLPTFEKQENHKVKPSMFNVGLGVAYVFGGKKTGTNLINKRKKTGNDSINVIAKSGSSDDDNEQRSKIYAGDNGEFEITNDQSLDGLYTFTPGQNFSGTGKVFIPFLGCHAAVEFKNIKVDTQAHLIHGKIIVQNTPNAPTFPRDWLLSGVGSSLNFSHNQVQGIMDWADDQSNNVPGLQYMGNNGALQTANTVRTPLIMNLDLNTDARFAITEMAFFPVDSKMNAVVSMSTPAEWNSTEQIGFMVRGAKFHTNSLIHPIGRAQIVADILIGNANHDISFRFKSAEVPANPNHPGCYLEWDENGFQQFGLEIEASFTRNWFTPIPDDGSSRSKATLVGQGSWGDIILTGNFEKSNIVNAHNLSIKATNLSFDMSDSMNPVNISFPSDYENLPNVQTNNIWRGFYAKNVTVELPDNIQTHQNGPVTVGVDDFIIDNQGLTMHAFAQNIVQWPQANISDLNASIDTLTVDILTNSLRDFRIQGTINIPTSSVDSIQNPLQFVGHYIDTTQIPVNLLTFPNTSITFRDVLYLNISPTGPIYSDLLRGELELYPNSEIYALQHKVGTNTIKRFGMNLQGVLLYDHINLDEVQDLELEVEFDDLGFEYDSDAGLHFLVPTFSLASPQKKAHGFPITINNITYESLPITGTEDLHGQLNFDLLMNLSGNSSSVSAATGLGIEFEIKNDAVNQRRFKPKYIATHVDSLAIDAHLKAVDISGNLFIKSNHPTYGKRVGGSLNAAFKGVDVAVGVEGEFGNTTFQNNNNKYRYWRVQANASFQNGIPFVQGLGFYGFAGGAYNNMNLQLDTSNPANITQNYTPHNHMFGLKIGATIGTIPLVDAFNADVLLEGAFSNAGQGMQYINFTGDFGTNAKVIDRRNGKGKINGNLTVQYDFPLKHFYLGVNANINADPITTPSPIWLALDIDGLHNNWYFKCGEPDYNSSSPNNLMNTVRITLPGEAGLNMYEYYMFGNDLPNVNGFTYKFNDNYAAAVGSAPGFGSNVGNISNDATTQLGTGMAFGVGFEVNKNINEHITGKYYLNAGINAGAEVNLSYMRYAGSCAGYNPIGINSWRANGSLGVYARAMAQLQKIKNGNIAKTWLLADLQGGAWMHGEFPKPYYIRGAIDGSINILNILTRDVHINFEKGTNCNNQPNNSTPDYQQQYATDEFNNNLIKYLAPSQNYNIPVTTPIAVKYNFEPDEVFHVSEQQANGSIINRTFKMVNEVKLIKATAVVNNQPQFSNNTMQAIQTNKTLAYRVNDIGDYQYILKPISINMNMNALQHSNGDMQLNQTLMQQVNMPLTAIINPTGSINQNQVNNIQVVNQTVSPTPLTRFPGPQPYLNDLSLNTFYKFTVTATLKELNYTNNQWEDALNTDGSIVRETITKIFRTGPMLPYVPVYSDGNTTILQNNITQ